ncbi:SPOR domain-containing protein [Paraburkholderia graminis]|jgi:DedD protein|uniref:SPOR domain-containing protein n=1 Tax=Paraburkholderia TaxID=1822464 RepID=UPI0006B3F874|nr:SPOR domain-containing protein [Paraburkholderia graminis]ALE57823.1 sporulation protein [Burkholderia sp. HB1]AXF12184.1 SPOR domain-containing protein [Paraburkholderia graminis]MDR6472079.1 DedD protein [Paraburkholderia graminis]
MGIFSFGKKDDAPSRRGANTSSTRAARSERVERRTRRTERTVDADAMLLDPTLPEKQRARRRLVGAIAMVVAAVVVLPMVLDSHPKPVTDDISIDIPSRPAPKLAKHEIDTQAGVAPDNPTPDAALAASSLAPAAQAPSKDTRRADANAASASAAKPATKPQAPAVAANTAPTPAPATSTAPAVTAKPTSKPATRSNATAAAPSADENNVAASADANSGTPASPPGNRFAVQLGAFANEANARNWASKLKAAGVPAYTEHRKQADGSTLTLLRAGPFADRAAASAAIAKVREAGLGSGTNNGASQ